MAYTTYSEIQGDLKEVTFSSTSIVKDTEVTQYIAEADALINSYVGMKYTVPVTTGDALNLLKLLSRSLVTARIKKRMEVKQEKNTDANQSVTGVLMSVAQVMQILKDIRDDNLTLAGAVQLVSGGPFYSRNFSDDVEKKILKDTKQW